MSNIGNFDHKVIKTKMKPTVCFWKVVQTYTKVHQLMVGGNSHFEKTESEKNIFTLNY